MKRRIDRLVAGIAPDAGPGLTDGAEALLTEIKALPVPPGSRPAATLAHRWRLRIAVPVVVALAMSVVALGWALPGLGSHPASAALDIRRAGGYYVVTVRNLFADPESYQAELRSRHLDVTLRVVPASPSAVGAIATFDKRMYGFSTAQMARTPDLIVPIQAPGTCTDMPDCTIGMKIPVHYSGHAEITLGRKGRPGERYADFGQLNNVGEPLECTSFVNKTFDQVRAMLRAQGVTITKIDVPLRGSPRSVPGSWYIQEGWLTEQGKAVVVAAPTPNPTPFSLADLGCTGHR